jgi:TATA-binding protein-associated factor
MIRGFTSLPSSLLMYRVVFCHLPHTQTLRKDIAALRRIKWLYCVLDEGHLIKNAKSQVTAAAKAIDALHRLILSGTPLQNVRVLTITFLAAASGHIPSACCCPLSCVQHAAELWSLFDFLMPGYLGPADYFQAKFGKPIAQAARSVAPPLCCMRFASNTRQNSDEMGCGMCVVPN